MYVGEHVEIIETADIVYIGNDFPKEIKGSEDTRRLHRDLYCRYIMKMGD